MVWKTITLAKDLSFSNSRSNRTRMGMERARKRGVILGRPRLRINLRRLKKLAAQGRTLREIAEALGCSKSCVQKKLAKTE